MRTLIQLVILTILSTSVAEAQSHTHGKHHVVHSKAKHSVVKPSKTVPTGIASEYHSKFHGRKTASGERYDKNKLTAAHLTLPLNSMIMVTNLKNGKHVKVRVNDRGPHIKGRILDMSGKAADAIALNGIAPVSYTIIR